MTLTLRIRHPEGMRRIEIAIDAPFSSLQDAITKQFKIPPQSQVISITSLEKPNFIDPSLSHKPISYFNFKNGQILYLVNSTNKTTTELDNKGDKNAFPPGSKCNHGPKGKCLQCSRLNPTEIEKYKGKCHHGPKTSCINCPQIAKKPVAIECNHKEDTFCNNCLPQRKLNASEEANLLKKQNCFCTEGQRCIFCANAERTEKSGRGDGKRFKSFSQYNSERKEICRHDRNSLDTATGFCSLCKPKRIVSYRMRECGRHAKWPQGICSQCMPPNALVRLQEYRHCDEVSVINFDCLKNFISGWLSRPAVQRICLLIGRVEELPQRGDFNRVRANVEAIYIPPQKSDGEDAVLVTDVNFPAVQRITESCGLKVVGWATTSCRRRSEKYGGEMVLSSRTILQAAKLQERFSDEEGHSLFTTMLIKQNESGGVEPECYQVSDQCVALNKEGLLRRTEDPGLMCIAQAGEMSPTVIYKSRELRENEPFLPDEFLVKVTPMSATSPRPVFRSNDFPQESAGEEDFRRVVHRTIDLSYEEKFSDFSLLLWVHKLVGLEGACELAAAVTKRGELSTALCGKLDAILAEFLGDK